MPTRITSTKTADHYTWGGDLGTDCDGWHLVRAADLSVIEELMPPGEGIEVAPRHRHQALNRSANFVRILVTSQPPSHRDRVNQ